MSKIVTMPDGSFKTMNDAEFVDNFAPHPREFVGAVYYCLVCNEEVRTDDLEEHINDFADAAGEFAEEHLGTELVELFGRFVNDHFEGIKRVDPWETFATVKDVLSEIAQVELLETERSCDNPMWFESQEQFDEYLDEKRENLDTDEERAEFDRHRPTATP